MTVSGTTLTETFAPYTVTAIVLTQASTAEKEFYMPFAVNLRLFHGAALRPNRPRLTR